MNIDRILWGIWWIGTILIICSWFDIVSPTVGWIGFGAGCASSLVSVIISKYWRIPPKANEVIDTGEFINLNGKTFQSLSNTENGEVSSETLFYYYQEGQIVCATYEGGSILKGTLLGKFISKDEIEFNYQHISKDDELKAGHCKSKILIQDDGKIKLEESWQWFTGDQSKGQSELIEKTDH